MGQINKNKTRHCMLKVADINTRHILNVWLSSLFMSLFLCVCWSRRLENKIIPSAALLVNRCALNFMCLSSCVWAGDVWYKGNQTAQMLSSGILFIHSPAIQLIAYNKMSVFLVRFLCMFTLQGSYLCVSQHAHNTYI